ncbi:MAG: hypothetical protein JOZ98_00530 [Solirubrobacterales bacterium]|nr:hypothetical protein [Solirubrobacterales bacterium]MBV9421369.1 hypothetical protein [Solirubrobacterales bacterium]MBV9800965.1 hypothetical protein [Solirubrobacterales bacterium]
MNAYDKQLPCGTELATLLEQVADDQRAPNPAHQDNCPYCQTALRRLRQDWVHVQSLAQEPVPIPEGLTAKIMARVHTLAGHLADSILLGHPRGETRIGHTVVSRVIQRLAATTPDVAFASVKLGPQDPQQPRRLSVTIRLIVTFGPAIERIADAVRNILNRRVPTLTGAELDRIDITINDITEPPD